MSASSETKFKNALRECGRLVEVANTYMQDGAYFTAAERLEKAADQMRLAGTIRAQMLAAL